MAKQTHDNGQGAGGNRRPALSEHPAFPMIIAAWFAALLSIGTMVVPTILIEKIVVATGLPAVLPAAAPPLGMTAQLLIAFTTGLIGGLIGLILARRLAGANDGGDEFRPIKAHEELGDGGLDAPVATQHLEEEAPEVPGFLLKASGESEGSFDAPTVWAEPELSDADREDGAEPWSEDVSNAESLEPAAEPVSKGEASGTAPLHIIPVDGSVEKDAQPPLDELELPQLVQRLGTSLERRRERLAANGDTVRLDETQRRSHWPKDEPAAAEDEAAMARAAFFGGPTPGANDAGDKTGPMSLHKGPENPEEALRNALETLQRLNGTA